MVHGGLALNKWDTLIQQGILILLYAFSAYHLELFSA